MTSAESLATKVVDSMFSGDEFSRWLGIKIVSVAPRECVLSMTLRPDMVNGFGVAHGGVVYSFADSALAFASNSTGDVKVSIENSISYPAPIRVGETLTARATEETSGARIGNYSVVVTNQDGVKVALFRGVVYATGKRHFEV